MNITIRMSHHHDALTTDLKNPDDGVPFHHPDFHHICQPTYRLVFPCPPRDSGRPPRDSSLDSEPPRPRVTWLLSGPWLVLRPWVPPCEPRPPVPLLFIPAPSDPYPPWAPVPPRSARSDPLDPLPVPWEVIEPSPCACSFPPRDPWLRSVPLSFFEVP
ncbi:MAG: hypothetical protein JWQ98_2184 [Chlorobi bacterium]|nr:hypothetical protein [Chlorobiota bacterium]